MRSFVAAVGAGAGTLAVVGVATAAVSGVALTVAKRVIKHRKSLVAMPCTQCGGSGFVKCQICMGRAIIRTRAPVSLRRLRKQGSSAPGGGSEPASSTALSACPACGTTLHQRCLNCLGEGRVCMPGAPTRAPAAAAVAS